MKDILDVRDDMKQEVYKTGKKYWTSNRFIQIEKNELKVSGEERKEIKLLSEERGNERMLSHSPSNNMDKWSQTRLFR